MPTVIPNNDERAALNEPTNVTFDTNCIIALEENRPAAQDLRRIVHGATEQRLRLRVVAISASERQPGGECSDSFRDFEAKIAGVGLLHAEILLPPLILNVSYLDHCIVGSEQFVEEAKRIHGILFPSSPFEYEDYCRHFGVDPQAPSLDRKWRNRAVDTWALWSHIHNGGGTFVTSDGNFHKKKVKLAQLGAGEILRPSEAAARFGPI